MDEWDAYFWPNSDVFKNKAGLTHAAALRSFEYEGTRQRAEQLHTSPPQGRFDTAHYRAIHRHLFQDVYDWAGEYRTVEFSKGNSAFAPLKTPVHTAGAFVCLSEHRTPGPREGEGACALMSMPHRSRRQGLRAGFARARERADARP